MKHILTSRSGKLSILLFWLLFCLLLLAFLVVEMGTTYQNYDYAEALLQRAANSAVENNMMDEYRADHILMLDTSSAEADFRSFAASDIPAKSSVTITQVSATASPPTLTATGTVTFQTVFSKYGFSDLTFSYTVRATNYDLD